MLQTTNYGLKQYEENDLMNPFLVDNANMGIIDATMKANSDAAISTATELKTGTVHAITRANGDAGMFRFTATSNYESGDTFTVDNVQVTALLTDGTTLGTGCYNIGAEVLCSLSGTRMTVFVQRGSVAIASDSERLGGELPAYYATDAALQGVNDTATSASNLAQQSYQAASIINNKLTDKEDNYHFVEGTITSMASGSSVTLARLPVSTPGYYLVQGELQVSGTTSGTLMARIAIDDTTPANTYPTMTTRMSSAGPTKVTCTRVIYLDPSNVFSLKGYQNSGSTVTVAVSRLTVKQI